MFCWSPPTGKGRGEEAEPDPPGFLDFCGGTFHPYAAFLNIVPADSRRLWIFWGLFCNFVEMCLIYFEFFIIYSVDVKKRKKNEKYSESIVLKPNPVIDPV
jgi:hypothetical protein